MSAPPALGQRVKFNKRCALNPNVPKNSGNYHFIALLVAEDDKFEGDGIIEAGTNAVIVDFAAHGTQTRTDPIVKVAGRRVRVAGRHLDPL